MKTKEEVKKSRSREVEESSSEKLSPAPSPSAVGEVGAGFPISGLFDSRIGGTKRECL
jgi:hypothetical protein